MNLDGASDVNFTQKKGMTYLLALQIQRPECGAGFLSNYS